MTIRNMWQLKYSNSSKDLFCVSLCKKYETCGFNLTFPAPSVGPFRLVSGLLSCLWIKHHTFISLKNTGTLYMRPEREDYPLKFNNNNINK